MNVTIEMKRMLKAKFTYAKILDEIATWDSKTKRQDALLVLKNISNAMVAIKADPSLLLVRKKKLNLIKTYDLNSYKSFLDGN